MGADPTGSAGCLGRFLLAVSLSSRAWPGNFALDRRSIHSDSRRRASTFPDLRRIYYGRRWDRTAVARAVLARALFFLSPAATRGGVLFIFHVRAVSSNRYVHGGCASAVVAIAYGRRRGVRNPRLGISFRQARSAAARHPNCERSASFGLAGDDRCCDLAG